MTILKTNLAMILLLLASTGLYAQTTYVPDDNFEQALIDLGYDDVLDDYVLTANINTVTTLSVHDRSISDLTGIEDFTALETLGCGQNNLTSLNVSYNIALSSLDCYDNNLISLDVSSNTLLTYLYCDRNNLTSLDVSSNTSLINLFCYENNITELDVSTNINLILLYCNDNNLTTLNVKNGNNQNVGPYDFNTINNPDLTCIQVDDVTYSMTYWTFIDPQHYFSENCSVGVNEFTSNALVVYPNPAQDFFQIKTERAVQKVTIYNMLGKAVAKFNPQEKYNVSDLKNGIYLVVIRLKNKTLNQKILIN